MIIAALLLLCGAASAADPSPREALARAAGGRVEFLRAVADVSRFAPRLPSKKRLYPYVLALDELEREGRRHGLASLGADPVKELGEELTRQAGQWLRLDRDPPEYLDAFFKWSANDTRVAAAGDSAMLAVASRGPEELLAWNRGARAALERLEAAKADASARQAFGDLQGVIVREILARRRELPPERLAEAVDGLATPQGLSEVLTFLDLETASAASPEDRRALLDLALRAARAARALGPSAPLRIRAEAGAAVAAAVERALFAGDGLDERLCRSVAAELLPAQAEGLLASLADLAAGGDGAPPAKARAVRAVAAGLQGWFPHLAAARRRDFQRIEARLSAREVRTASRSAP